MISGIINVYKEAGFTSHDVVAKLRGICHQKKIGHAGTLDPDAVGVLPVCLGKATRLADVIGGNEKVYETVLLLGRETDTQDISGTVLAEAEVTCSERDIQQLLPRFVGDLEQIPPMYSAKKQQGKKLYELARQGVTVERQAARIHIAALQVLDMELPRVRLRVTCSKGTYIRTLCHDIGKALGCGGCMESLIRTRVGSFLIEEAATLSTIEEAIRGEAAEQIVRSPDTFFRELPACAAKAQADHLAVNGNGIPAGWLEGEASRAHAPAVRLYQAGGAFLGIYEYRREKDMYFPRYFLYDARQ